MLMLSHAPKTAAVSNIYFNPVRFRPVFRPAYARIDFPKSRVKKESQVDLDIDVKPSNRNFKGTTSQIKSDDENVDDDDEDDEENDGDESETVPEPKEDKKRKENHKKGKPSKAGNENYKSTIEHLCTKLRLSFVLAVLGGIILLACCCALFLRNRIVACCKKCWPCRKKKKESKKDLFDVEGGGYPYQTSGKSSKKKKKGNAKMIDTGVQDSRTSVLKTQEEASETLGCSPCCKKKKKKKNKKKTRK